MDVLQELRFRCGWVANNADVDVAHTSLRLLVEVDLHVAHVLGFIETTFEELF